MQIEEAGGLRSAMLAGVATGIYPSLTDAVLKMVAVKDRFEPNKDNVDVYERAYQRYLGLYKSLLGIYEMD